MGDVFFIIGNPHLKPLTSGQDFSIIRPKECNILSKFTNIFLKKIELPKTRRIL